MDYPRHVIRVPGNSKSHNMVPHDLRYVLDASEHKAARAEGFCDDYAEALSMAGSAPAAAPDDNAPPTRAEIEQEAEALGIRLDRRWGDKRLLDEIAAAHLAKAAKPASVDSAAPGEAP